MATAVNDGKKFSGKVALVTGGTSGIGKATVEHFLREGASAVVFTGRRAEVGIAMELSLNSAGRDAGDPEVRAVFICADHSNAEDCSHCVYHAVELFGRIDILVNNAGIVLGGGTLTTSEEDWDETMNVNLTSVWRMIKLVIPHMLKQNHGVIVNNASDWGIVASPMAVAYCVSKAAVIQLTKAVALEYAKQGIRCNAVCPGDTQVERWSSDGYFRGSGPVSDADVKADGADLPIGRVAAASEIAECIAFLASSASSYMTGSCLVADGGNTAQ
jgi:NAD(P)-dependent dehydrogenase (short-subunit alcohol dehydrogenase family)